MGITPAVHERELHCRQGWGSDRWEAAAEDVVIAIRVREPDVAPTKPAIRDFDRLEPSDSAVRTAESVIGGWESVAPSDLSPER